MAYGVARSNPSCTRISKEGIAALPSCERERAHFCQRPQAIVKRDAPTPFTEDGDADVHRSRKGPN
jgi:hypothetical protein